MLEKFLKKYWKNCKEIGKDFLEEILENVKEIVELFRWKFSVPSFQKKRIETKKKFQKKYEVLNCKQN